MRKNLIIFSVCLTMIFPSLVYAKSGSAILPAVEAYYISSQQYSRYMMFISNITDEDIDVTLTFYNDDGSIYQDGDDSKTAGEFQTSKGTVTNWDDNPTGASVTFTLAGRDTTILEFRGDDPNRFRGHGIIEWSQDSDELQGLVVGANYEFWQNSFQTWVDDYEYINNGLPF